MSEIKKQWYVVRAIGGDVYKRQVYDTFKRLTGVRLMEGFGQTETTLTLEIGRAHV